MADERKDHPDLKRPQNRSDLNNSRPITYRLMWKILTVQITEEICDFLISCGLFPEEQKNTARGPEIRQSNHTLINMFSRTAKQDGKKSSSGVD